MSEKYLTKHTSAIETSQSQPIPGREEDMTPNNAGGFTFKADKWTQLERFLVLGTEGGTYYISEQKLTVDNAKNVRKCISEDGARVARIAAEISDLGRAPKNDPAIFVLAMVSKLGDAAARREAFSLFPKICRIGTHLYQFCEYRKHLDAGWGRGMKRAIQSWYLNKTVENITYQLIKYRQRGGWSHRDLLRKSHPPISSGNVARDEVMKWVVDPDKFRGENFPNQLQAFLEVQSLDISKGKKEVERAINLIVDNRLPREALPTEFLNEKAIWEALLQDMPMTALIRNLATLTRVGVIKPLSENVKKVCEQITDEERLKKARVHPLQLLIASRIYEAGQGDRGKHTWEPIPQIVKSLDEAFHLAFQNVEPTGKRLLLGVDISGSMWWGGCTGATQLMPGEGAAVMALATAKVEPNYHIMGFAHEFRNLPIHSNMSLNQTMKVTRDAAFGGTDCALPMIYAKRNKLEVDCFIVYTDSETWSGGVHPMQALRAYRKVMNIPAKLIVVAMESIHHSIADPKDTGSLDIVGFDTSVPRVISDFVRN